MSKSKPIRPLLLTHISYRSVQTQSFLVEDTHLESLESNQEKLPSTLARRNWRLIWGRPSNETSEIEAPCHSMRGTIKVPPDY